MVFIYEQLKIIIFLGILIDFNPKGLESLFNCLVFKRQLHEKYLQTFFLNRAEAKRLAEIWSHLKIVESQDRYGPNWEGNTLWRV